MFRYFLDQILAAAKADLKDTIVKRLGGVTDAAHVRACDSYQARIDGLYEAVEATAKRNDKLTRERDEARLDAQQNLALHNARVEDLERLAASVGRRS